MTPSRLIDVLNTLCQQRWPAFIWGPPGVGKSSIVRSVAAAKQLPVIDLRASLLDPTDLRGIPSIQYGVSHWCPPSFLPKPGDTPGILFLDEINAAPPLVQAALYQLVLDRRIGEYVLPANWWIVAAGNRHQDRAVVFRMSSALSNRFVHVDLDVSSTDWRDWARDHGIHHLVNSFIALRPDLLFQAPQDDVAYPTPRSWEILSDVLHTFSDQNQCRDLLKGIIGEGTSIEFVEFTKRTLSEAHLRQIVASPTDAELPSSLDGLYTLTTWLAYHCLAEEVLNAVGIVVNRIPPEYGVLLIRDVLKKNPTVTKLSGYKSFVKTHGQLLTRST